MPTVATEESLASFLTARARRTSDGRLTANAVAGLVAIIAVLIWRPFGAAPLLSIATCFVAFGVWGIADRELSERRRTASSRVLTLLRVLRAIAVIIGAAGTVGFLFGSLAIALGTWIS